MSLYRFIWTSKIDIKLPESGVMSYNCPVMSWTVVSYAVWAVGNKVGSKQGHQYSEQ